MVAINDTSGNGFGTRGSTIPQDWTGGTGVFPAGGVITVPAPAAGSRRSWMMVQNQGAAQITVSYQAVTALGNNSVVNMVLATGGVAGSQGGADERGLGSWRPNGTVVITGAVGAQVLVLEVTE